MVVIAAKAQTEPAPGDDDATASLADLRPGERGRIIGHLGPDEPITQRLFQLGLLKGRRVEVIRRAPAGDPIEVRVLGYCLSLRLREAGLVSVERVHDEEGSQWR